MIVPVAGIPMELTDDQVADLRRFLAIPDAEIDAEVAQRDQAALEEADALGDQAQRDSGLIDTNEAARRLGRSRDFVYAHAAELGVMRIGDGPKPRLFFDPATIAARLTSSRPSSPAAKEPPAPRRRRRSGSQPRGELLKIRGERP